MLLSHRRRGATLTNDRRLADLVRSVPAGELGDRVFVVDEPRIADFDGQKGEPTYSVHTVPEAARSTIGRVDEIRAADYRTRLRSLPPGHAFVVALGQPSFVPVEPLLAAHPPAPPRLVPTPKKGK